MDTHGTDVLMNKHSFEHLYKSIFIQITQLIKNALNGCKVILFFVLYFCCLIFTGLLIKDGIEILLLRVFLLSDLRCVSQYSRQHGCLGFKLF